MGNQERIDIMISMISRIVRHNTCVYNITHVNGVYKIDFELASYALITYEDLKSIYSNQDIYEITICQSTVNIIRKENNNE